MNEQQRQEDVCILGSMKDLSLHQLLLQKIISFLESFKINWSYQTNLIENTYHFSTLIVLDIFNDKNIFTRGTAIL